MPKAYVLVNVDAGSDDEVFKAIKAIKNMDGIGESHIVLGAADIIVEIESGDPQTVREVIYEKIRKIPQVRSTQTMTVVE
jgi:DNA-binding Lrp family transcriptional regulator